MEKNRKNEAKSAPADFAVRGLVAVLMAVMLLGQGCTNAPSAAAVAASKKTDINVWGVLDDVDVYEQIFKDYRQLHPFVNINFRRFRLEEYEDQLLNAMAEDRGPDIFLIHNTWVGKYAPKIQPMPASTKVAVQTVVGTLKKEVQYQLNTEPTVTQRQYKLDYPDVVATDFIRTNKHVHEPGSEGHAGPYHGDPYVSGYHGHVR